MCVLLGATVFDGVSGTLAWSRLTGGRPTPAVLALGTVGLAAAIACVGATYLVCGRLASRLAVHTRLPGAGRDLPAAFAHSLVPIAVGYTVAHYFSLLVFQGQAGYILATDPLGTGADLLGTAGWQVDYPVVSPRTIAVVQVLAIVVGHVAGVVVAHDRAVGLFAAPDRRRSQYPLLAAMVLYPCGGIALLVGA